MLCIHGVMGHGGRFRRLVQTYLADRQVIAVDLRQGAETPDREPPSGRPNVVADVCETMDAEGIAHADVVGFSFGGRLGVELAAAHPERVRRLALLDPAIQLAPAAALDFADQTRPDVSFADLDEAVTARLATLEHTPREMVDEDVAEALETGPDGRLRYRV